MACKSIHPSAKPPPPSLPSAPGKPLAPLPPWAVFDVSDPLYMVSVPSVIDPATESPRTPPRARLPVTATVLSVVVANNVVKAATKRVAGRAATALITMEPPLTTKECPRSRCHPLRPSVEGSQPLRRMIGVDSDAIQRGRADVVRPPPRAGCW